MEGPAAVPLLNRPKEVVPGNGADEDGGPVDGRRRVDRARPALDLVLDLERRAGDGFRSHSPLEGGEGSEGRDGDRGGGPEAAPEGDHRSDLEPQGRALPGRPDGPPHVRVLRVLEGGAVHEPLVVDPREHLRAEVDRGREGGLPEDDRVLPEQDELPRGGGARHPVRNQRRDIKGSSGSDAMARRFRPSGSYP